MRIKLKVFASVKEICGFGEKELIVSDSITVGEIIETLISKNENLESKKDSLLIAVNLEYCDSSRILKEGDTVALFPPVSGG